MAKNIFFLGILFFLVACNNGAELPVQIGALTKFTPKLVNAMLGDQIKFTSTSKTAVRLSESDTLGVCKRSTKADAFFGEMSPDSQSVTFTPPATGKYFLYDTIETACDDWLWFTLVVDERPASAPGNSNNNGTNSTDGKNNNSNNNGITITTGAGNNGNNSTPSEPQTDSGGSKPSTSAIVGITGVVVAVLGAIGAYFKWRNSAEKSKMAPAEKV